MRIDPERQDWMGARETRAVMDALGEARFVGGAVRDALLGENVADIDIATPLTPDEVIAGLEQAGIRVIPTGLAHGTVTAATGGRTFEITTLRRDMATDGRHAEVAFTTDWEEDAARRDFTINALYAAQDGEIFDYAGGVEDLIAGRVRFVGEAARRIAEDYLRILRLFRFHAWYGRGEIDAEALRASADAKSGLARLSGERVAKEFLRLLECASPAPVLRVMAAAAILPEILPGALQLPRLERLAGIEADNFFARDGILRLAALLPGDAGTARAAARRFKLSNAQSERLEALAHGADEKIVSHLSVRDVRRLLYRIGAPRFMDHVFLEWAGSDRQANAIQWRMLLAVAEAWERPRFPLTGREVMLAGVPEGPEVGRVLAEVEQWWIDGDFAADEFALAERLKAVARALR